MENSWWDSVSGIAGKEGLGQRVIDVLAPTVHQHINLMNSEGVIVASTDPERIGAEHQAALEVLRTARPVNVNQPVHGVLDRPGINLPLIIDDHVSGVVGVTGNPAEVRSVAQVIALTVKLLIEQEREHRSSFAARGRARDIVTTLVSSTQTSEQCHDLLNSADLGQGPWSLGVWASSEVHDHGSSTPPYAAEQIAAEINIAGKAGSAGKAIAVVWRRLLWVVATGTVLSESVGGTFTRRLVASGIPNVQTLCSWAQDMAALGERALLLPAGTPTDPPLELAIAVARLPEPTLHRMAREAAQLSPSQRDAARALASANSVAEASRRLYLHRNTLLQSVRRIRAISGLDMRNPEESAAMRISLLAWECTHSESAKSTQ